MINIKLDPKSLLEACKYSKEEVEKALISGVKKLATATHAHIINDLSKELGPSLRKVFLGGEDQKNIHLDEIDPTTHVITLSGSAALIDDGSPRRDMKTDDWLFSSDKTRYGKNGRYLVIPFQHNKNSKSQSGYAKHLADRVQFELKAINKKRKQNNLEIVPWKQLERNKEGQIKEGFLHEFNMTYGKASSKWSNDPLERLRVYQAVEKDKVTGEAVKDKRGRVKATRSWMTFRTASESKVPNPETGVSPSEKFWYPEVKAAKLLEKAGEWAEEKFYNEIIPSIFEKWKD